jgi:hypothetical protein
MDQIEPRIVDRFPGHRERILQKRFQDSAVAELCRDYDCLIETLEAAGNRQGATGGQASETRKELLELAIALEKELLDRLGLGY